ncbi:unnamed protein product, partial [Meganyctiphanes norvegica]
MEGSACIVCFKSYDDHKRRPRIMPCGHTMCSVCLGRIIRKESKMCPTCREVFTADNVEEFKVNYALENSQKSKEDKQSDGEDYPMATGHRALENTTTENLIECAEHELPVINRCSTHKGWVCQKCIKRDHSSESCKMITISEELNIKKELQLSQSQPILKKFDEACKKSGDCRKQLKKVMEECISKRSQEYIQRTETLKNQMEKNYAVFDKKLGNLEGQRSIYEKSVDYLKSSDTIKGVSRYLDEVQNETENLQLISEKIEKEVQLTLEDDLSDLQTKYQVLHQEKEQSFEESRHKLASLEKTIKKNKTLEDDLSDLQTKYQVLHQEKEQSFEESRHKITSLEKIIKKNKESSVSSVWLWSAAFIFAGLALAYGFSVSNMQSEKNLLEKKPHQLEDHLLSEKSLKKYIMSEKNLLEERLHQLEDNLLSEKEMNKDIMSENNLLEERLHQLEDNLLSEKVMKKDIMSENNLLEERLHQLEDNLLSEKERKKDIMSENNLLEERLHQLEDNLLSEKERKKDIMSENNLLEERLHQLEDNLLSEKERKKDIMSENNLLEERLHQLEDNLLSEKERKKDIMSEKSLLVERLHQLEDTLLSDKEMETVVLNEKNLLEEKLHQLEDHLLSEKEMNKDIMSEKNLLEKRLHYLEDHLLREKQKTKHIMFLEDDLSDLQTKYQVLHQEKEQCLEESRQTIAYLEASIKNNKETSVSSAVWLWSAAIIFAGLAFGYRVSYMQ